MRVCGIICEYDPFHNGHAYHIQCAREQCDYVICVMSGHFTQRGNPALLSKWARAEMALLCGADAVFELPALFAVRDAERFASGGVALLDALSVVTDLAFGSESGDISALYQKAARLENVSLVKAGLSEGKTLARARAEATDTPLVTPNDILAVEYIRAILKSGSKMEPRTVLRQGSAYHDLSFHALASATGIRKAIRSGMDVRRAIPEAAYHVLSRAMANGETQSPDGLDAALFYRLRTLDPEKLSQIADISEGLENRILKMAQNGASRRALLEAVKCKRYTWSRLSRVLTQAMLGITKEIAAQNQAPVYARLLGFRESAGPLLSKIKKGSKIPIITRAAKAPENAKEALSIDILASDIWSLGLLNPSLRHGGRDLMTSVLIVREDAGV